MTDEPKTLDELAQLLRTQNLHLTYEAPLLNCGNPKYAKHTISVCDDSEEDRDISIRIEEEDLSTAIQDTLDGLCSIAHVWGFDIDFQ